MSCFGDDEDDVPPTKQHSTSAALKRPGLGGGGLGSNSSLGSRGGSLLAQKGKGSSSLLGGPKLGGGGLGSRNNSNLVPQRKGGNLLGSSHASTKTMAPATPAAASESQGNAAATTQHPTDNEGTNNSNSNTNNNNNHSSDNNTFDFDESYDEIRQKHQQRKDALRGITEKNRDQDRHTSRHQDGLEESRRIRERTQENQLIDQMRNERLLEEEENPELREKDKRFSFITPSYQKKLEEKAKQRQRDRDAAVRKHQVKAKKMGGSGVNDNEDSEESEDDVFAAYETAGAGTDDYGGAATGTTQKKRGRDGDSGDDSDGNQSNDDDEGGLAYKEVTNIIARENLDTLAFHNGNDANTAATAVPKESKSNENVSVSAEESASIKEDAEKSTSINTSSPSQDAAATTKPPSASNNNNNNSSSSNSKPKSIQQQYEDALAAVEAAMEKRRVQRSLKPPAVSPGTAPYNEFEQIYLEAVQKRRAAMTMAK